MSVLSVERLCASLGGKPVLREVSFGLAGGELVGLIGPNGAGKSTLLRAMLGLTPSTGTLRSGNDDLRRLTPRERAKRVAYLPQERDVVWSLTVERLVALGRTPHLAPMRPETARDRAAIDTAMAQTDTAHLRNRPVAEMSGGERARVLMARALAQDAPVLLADEPVAGLDPAHQIALMEIFARLAGEGRTIVITLHELQLAARWCPRLLMLQDGSLVADGPPRDVLTRPRLADVYGVETYLADSAHGPIVMPIERREIAS
jgi:iron complex transport system ATP-binding protein